ncbi:MAG: TlyA family RNA methyltransferase [Planctomycetes bacterium]|nr:TlyA family RNA methyltransferase [Planctomycetota bacterium]
MVYEAARRACADAPAGPDSHDGGLIAESIARTPQGNRALTSEPDHPYVSRGGLKLAAALTAFDLDVTGLVCADLGSHVGGFVDCLLQRGAARVYSVDTSYGTLAWSLRKVPRVVVLERTNALHVELPEPVDLVTVDVGWTRQHLILPVALRALTPKGVIVSLIKPHYEADPSNLRRGVLPDDECDRVLRQVEQRLSEANIHLSAIVESPIRGRAGNREFLALVPRVTPL